MPSQFLLAQGMILLSQNKNDYFLTPNYSRTINASITRLRPVQRHGADGDPNTRLRSLRALIEVG